jgi:hypothetical protein
VVGDRLGAVPDSTPMVPLQQDLRREQKRLRLEPRADWKDIELDLRNTKNTLDRNRSTLLRRLNLLGVAWGRLDAAAAGLGTSKERWRIQWQPELDVALIEAAPWGNTIADAAVSKALDGAAREQSLPALVRIVNQTLLADLPAAVAGLMARLEERAALTSDVGQLMDALCEEDAATRVSLAYTLRYGDQVRRTDAEALAHVVASIVARICVGLPNACATLDDDAAQAMFGRIVGVDGALRTIRDEAHLASWHAALWCVADMRGVHGLVAGRCTRILLDMEALDADEAERRVSQALSPGTPPANGAAWIEGLLRDGAALLLADDRLWAILDGWLVALPDETFQQTLPLLRRTFGTFTAPERRKMGERARRGGEPRRTKDEGREAADDFDQERGEAVLPLVALLLGADGGV